MNKPPFAQALVRKSNRALRVARLALNAGANDSAVSRSYYAMFDMARAALLRAGITEDMLPRTHSGVIEAFGTTAGYQRSADKGDDKVSDPGVTLAEAERVSVNIEPVSLEEIRRQARENWLRLRQQPDGADNARGDPQDANRGRERGGIQAIDDLDS